MLGNKFKKLQRWPLVCSKDQNYHQQESPPAWMQEAYRPLCSKYSLCCPNWVPPLGGVPGQVPPPGGSGYPRGGTQSGTPPGGTRSGQVRYPPGGSGYPPWGGTRSGQVPPPRGSGYPPGGGVRVPPRGVPSQVPGGVWVPPGGVPGQVPPGGVPGPPLPPCGQTNTCENSTFPSYYVRGR